MYFMIPKDITVYKDVLNVLNDWFCLFKNYICRILMFLK